MVFVALKIQSVLSDPETSNPQSSTHGSRLPLANLTNYTQLKASINNAHAAPKIAHVIVVRNGKL